jgi:hypothetical protein
MLCAASAAHGASSASGCDTVSSAEASMWVRYLNTGVRETFDVSAKMPATGGGRANSTWPVLVGREQVGRLTLKPRDNGFMSGSLSFDSYANNGQADPGVAPFPPNWPYAGTGTPVRVGGLECRLAG